MLDTVRTNTSAVLRGAETAASRVGAVANALSNRRSPRDSPIEGPLSQQRRFVAVRTDLADYRKVRQAHGGTVNDVILATVTGALRAWLMTRAESLSGMRKIRAVVPISVIDEELEATSLGTQIAAHLVSLPDRRGEPGRPTAPGLLLVPGAQGDRAGRGRQPARRDRRLRAGDVPRDRLAGRRRRDAPRGFQISITNVPGPQSPLYAAGARMLETYPVHPLQPGHALSIGVTSYDGSVFYGITADRDMLPDVDVLGQCVTEALDELLDTASGARPRVPRGRKKRGRRRRRRPSMSVRVYLPATLAALATLRRRRARSRPTSRG